MSDASPAFLSIFRQEQSYTFHLQLAQPTAVTLTGVVQASQLRFADQFTHAAHLLNQRIQEGRASDSSADPLFALGRLVYHQLFPPVVQQGLADLAPGAAISLATNAPEIPWELAHDGVEHLALHYAISRQLPLQQPSRQNRTRSEPRWSALLIGNPTGDLPESDREIERLAHLITATPGTAPPRILMRQRASKESVLQELASGVYQWVHYAGHTAFDPANPQTSGLLLARGQLLTAHELQQALGGQPFVVLNGCQSAALGSERGGLPNGAGYLAGAAQGLAAAFLQGGAQGVLGACWPLHDASSVTFVLNFYRAALQGEPLAAALRVARRQTRQNNPLDPQWAAFILYAPAQATIGLPTTLQRRPATVLAVTLHRQRVTDQAPSADVLSHAMQTWIDAIDAQMVQLGGRVAMATPSLVLGLFGISTAYQNDAERAVRAALEIRDAIPTWPMHSEVEQVSMGVSSGDLYTRSISSAGSVTLLLGQAVDEAIKLAQAAPPATILLASSVHQLVQQHFDCTPVDGLTLGGTGWQVHGTQRAARRAGYGRGQSTSLVGRSRELGLLQAWWRAAEQGQSQLVGLAGEAGVGKSRLAAALHTWLEGKSGHWLVVPCSAVYQPGPYEVIGQLVQTLLGAAIGDTDHPDKSPVLRNQLTQVLDELGSATASTQQQQESLALLCEILGAPDPDVPLSHLDAAARQRRLVGVLGRWFSQLAVKQPVVLVLEDLQGADQASLEVLHHLLSNLDRLRILVLALFRSEQNWQPPWNNRRNYQRLHLPPLDDAERRALLHELLKERHMEAEQIEAVCQRSNGNPLFLRELAAAYAEQSRPAMRVGTTNAWLGGELPGTVQRLILARIETLSPPAQHILALAAVMGDTFEEPLLQHIVQSGGEIDMLETALNELSQREFIYRDWGEADYHFSHALVREVAEGRLLGDERQRFHRRIGEGLEQAAGGRLERLAHHFYWSVVMEERVGQPVLTEGNDPHLLEKAASYLLRVGQNAQAKYAAREALRHYQRGWVVAQALPDHLMLRIDLHDGRGAAHQMRTELDAAVEQLTQAYRLLEPLENQPAQRRRLADLARRIGRLHEWKSEYAVALGWIERGQRLLQTLSGLETQAVAAALSIRLGSVHYNKGDLEQAAAHCERGLALANPLSETALQAEAHNLLGIVADVQGLTQQAFIHYSHSLQLWQMVGDEYQVARVEDNIGQLLLYMGEWGAARDHLKRGCAFWEQIEDEYSLAFASLNLGVVALYQGQWAEADSRFVRALHLWEKTQNQRWIALCYTNLGLLALAQQQWQAAQLHLQHSQELLLALHIRDLLPETYYGLAEAALGQGQVETADQLANQAITLAVEQRMRLEQAIALRVLGKVRLARNELAAAQPLLQESVMLLERLNNRYELGRTLVQLAHLQTVMGDPAATHSRQQAHILFTQLGARADLEALVG